MKKKGKETWREREVGDRRKEKGRGGRKFLKEREVEEIRRT